MPCLSLKLGWFDSHEPIALNFVMHYRIWWADSSLICYDVLTLMPMIKTFDMKTNLHVIQIFNNVTESVAWSVYALSFIKNATFVFSILFYNGCKKDITPMWYTQCIVASVFVLAHWFALQKLKASWVQEVALFGSTIHLAACMHFCCSCLGVTICIICK